MKYIKAHKRLDAWTKAMDLVVVIYGITATFPKSEHFGIVSQLRRACVSIPSNIAEGAARNSNKEFIQFLYIALGSCSEVDTQVLISQRLGFLQNGIAESVLQKIDDLDRVLHGLIRYRKNKQ